jgi:hypothetical protein
MSTFISTLIYGAGMVAMIWLATLAMDQDLWLLFAGALVVGAWFGKLMFEELTEE